MRLLKIIPLLFFLCFFAEVRGQASNKTAQIATLPIGTTTVRINALSSQIEIFKTKGTRISIETAVRIKIGTLPLLDYLFKSGRYKMDVLVNGQLNMLTLSPPINNNVLLVKGAECEENITYKIHIPETVKHIETLNSNQGDFVPHQ
jgi:hypothetical protein